MGWYDKWGKWVAAAATGGTSMLVDGSGKELWEDFTGQTSARKQNEKNIQLQKETNQQSIDLANTAHQREVADLKAAGLNPVLSAGGQGSATPQLGTAQVQNEYPGGHMAQVAQMANIANLAGTAKQAVSNSNLATQQAAKTAVDTAYAPQIAKSEIAKNLADAQNATSSKQYNEIMGQVNQMIGDAQTQKALAETGLIQKDSKGRITLNFMNAGANVLSGIGNVAGATKGMGFNPINSKVHSTRAFQLY